MASITLLQYKLLDLLAHHQMNGTNGATPTRANDVNTYLWADEFAAELGVSEQTIGGVITSLQDACLVWVIPKSKGDKDGGIGFTENGFRVWQGTTYDQVQAEADRKIILTFKSVDGYRKTVKAKTLAGARKAAHHRVGKHPEIGTGYAVSGDGVVKVTVQNATLAEIFPAD